MDGFSEDLKIISREMNKGLNYDVPKESTPILPFSVKEEREKF